MVLETGDPNAIIKSEAASSVLGQTHTKIFLYNPNATPEVYIDSLGLNGREFERVKSMGMRRILVVKNNIPSVELEFDLGGEALKEEMAFLSSSTQSALALEEIRKQHGDDPEVWLPIWESRRKRSR